MNPPASMPVQLQHTHIFTSIQQVVFIFVFHLLFACFAHCGNKGCGRAVAPIGTGSSPPTNCSSQNVTCFHLPCAGYSRNRTDALPPFSARFPPPIANALPYPFDAALPLLINRQAASALPHCLRVLHIQHHNSVITKPQPPSTGEATATGGACGEPKRCHQLQDYSSARPADFSQLQRQLTNQ